MNTRPAIMALVTAVLAVLAAVWVVRTDEHVREQREQRPGELLQVSLPVDAVERITLIRSSARDRERRLVFERSPDGWQQVEPFRYPMDLFSMRQLAVAAAQAQVVERISQTRGSARDRAMMPEMLGLDPPEAIVTFDWPGGQTTIELGRRGIAGRAYARLAGEDQILVINQDMHVRVLEMDPKEWRERVLFRSVGIDSDRIVREEGQTRVVLERDRRQWRMIEPVRTRLDSEAFDSFLQRLGSARAIGFIADEPSSLDRFGLARPLGSFSISAFRSAEKERVQTLLVGASVGSGGDHYCMMEGTPAVFRVPGQVLQALFADVRELIDPTGTGVHPEDVKTIRIASSSTNEEFVLERSLDRWLAVSHDGRDVQTPLVQTFLNNLCATRAAAVEIVSYPRELEAARITLHGFDGRPLDTVRVVRDPASGQWALENGDDVLRIFPNTFDLKLTPAEYGIR